MQIYTFWQIFPHESLIFWFSVVPKTPTLTAKPSTSVVKAGTEVTLTCKTDSSGSSLYYTFYKDGQEIPNKMEAVYTVPPSDSTLPSNYTCKATIDEYQSAQSPVYTLTFLGKIMGFLKLIYTFLLRSLLYLFSEAYESWM